MRSAGIPPRATLVCGGHPRPVLIDSPFHKVRGAGIRLLPLTPEDAPQLTVNPAIKFFEDTLTFRQPEIVHPSSQYRCERLDKPVQVAPYSPASPWRSTTRDINTSWFTRSKNFSRSMSTTHRRPASTLSCARRTASWALRPGRNP